MRILVTFAVEAEFAPWRQRHDFAVTQFSDLTAYRAKIADASVLALLTGIGAKRAGSATLGIQMIATESKQFFDACISTGLGGALKPEISVGEVVVAKEVCSVAVRTDLGKTSIPCDAKLVALAIKSGAREVRTFFQADHIVISAAEKAKLADFADVVEMESFDVVSECSAWGTRALAVRAISDASEGDLPLDLNRAITETGGVSVSRIVGQALLRPHRIPGLVRFGRQSRQAAESLASFLDAFVNELAGHSKEFSTAKKEVAQAQ
jgi:nucleoside phosphorylase